MVASFTLPSPGRSRLAKTVSERESARAKESLRLGLVGSAFKRLGDLEGAIRAYKAKLLVEAEVACAIVPASQPSALTDPSPHHRPSQEEHGKTHFMIGEVFCKLGLWTDAVAAFDRAIAFNPEASAAPPLPLYDLGNRRCSR